MYALGIPRDAFVSKTGFLGFPLYPSLGPRDASKGDVCCRRKQAVLLRWASAEPRYKLTCQAELCASKTSTQLIRSKIDDRREPREAADPQLPVEEVGRKA